MNMMSISSMITNKECLHLLNFCLVCILMKDFDVDLDLFKKKIKKIRKLKKYTVYNMTVAIHKRVRSIDFDNRLRTLRFQFPSEFGIVYILLFVVCVGI